MLHTEQPLKQFSLRSRVVGAPKSWRARQAMIGMCPANGAAGRFAQRLAHGSARVSGKGVLRSIADWPLPISEAAWGRAERHIRSCFPALGDQVIWHLPPSDQAQIKFGTLFLDEKGTSQAFARVLLSGRAAELTPCLERGARTGIRWPMRLALLVHDGLSIEVTTAAPSGLHVPAHLDLPSAVELAADVGEALMSERPGDVPAHWRPMHGDMASWNLRRFGNGNTVLLDWEESAWAPPHADLVRFIMTAPDGLTLVPQLETGVAGEMAEAVDFWQRRLVASGFKTAPDWVTRKHMAQQGKLRAILGSH